jgi:hypothetical protein
MANQQGTGKHPRSALKRQQRERTAVGRRQRGIDRREHREFHGPVGHQRVEREFERLLS